jgi:AcrR family transcriptional regulator
MFVGTGTIRKPEAYKEARRLRAEEGMPMKRIAVRVGVSPATVHAWTRDIKLTQEQVARNLGRGVTANREVVSRRARAWAERNRARRDLYQLEGRLRARDRDPVHMAGCMLYWAEGAKSRNTLAFANSDLNMVRFFCYFVRAALGVPPEQLTLRLNVYTGNGMTVREIEDHWLLALRLPRSCLRGHTLNHTPTSSSGQKKNRLPYGVASIRVLRSTHLVQHVFGAIQEYIGFDEPRWLDGPPVKPGRRAAR